MSKTSSAKASKTQRRSKSVAPTDRSSRVVAEARRAVRKALKAHKAAGVPIVVWRDGKVVRIRPEDI